MTNNNSQSGVTLVELILYLAIASIVLGAIGTMYTTIVTLRNKNQAIQEVEQQGQHVMHILTVTTKNAVSITTPAVGATGATMSIQTNSSPANPTVFSVTSGLLSMKEGTATAVPLHSSAVAISNFSVRNLTRTGTDGIARFSFTLTYSRPGAGQSVTRTFQTSAAVRGVYP